MSESDLTPDEERFYATSSTTVLNDILADTATRLGGKLVALARAATTDTERQRWRDRMYEVEDQKEAIDPEDRDALVSHIRQWKAEVARLRDQQA
ncbi:putative secreted protein [Nocardiopsis arvandica]|uniref:Putative secreted protein n=1 Tax=Nocardiopsis sinuspersici TaxID=501010 RepID=A0A7Z0BNA1_9ACTN|nr:putative secreted protein [Nocardiopsis sinuspersici]